MIVSLIAAIGEQRELGYQNRLLWKISEDLRTFKRLTIGKALFMGRKTFESIGKPLPGRTTYVLSRNSELAIPGVEVVTSFEQALEQAERLVTSELVIAGGGEIYARYLDRADRLYLSKIHAKADQADTFFPEWSERDWKLVESQPHQALEDGTPAWTLEIYERRS